MTCENCAHFEQHYYLDAQYCGALDCGHCIRGRTKHRKASASACAHFQEREHPPRLPDRNGVIHFLTTKILQRLMEMELPPEVL